MDQAGGKSVLLTKISSGRVDAAACILFDQVLGSALALSTLKFLPVNENNFMTTYLFKS